MRNKLPCTAQKLSQIQPEMIQSVVGPQTFQLGKEYQSANCVQILEADEDQILSEVTGPFGLYEQTIQLKGGNLLTKCSCTSNEQPFCRHCVAVLLGFPRPDAVREGAGVTETSSMAETVKGEEPSLSPVSVNLHHISIFIDWLQQAVRALDRGHALPDSPPAVESGDVVGWIRGIHNLHTRWRISEEKRLGAEAELLKREGQLESLMKELEVLPRDAKDALGVCEDIQDALSHAGTMLARLCEISREREQLEDQLKSTTGDLVQKSSELTSLFASLREVAAVVQSVSGPTVH